jgi:permease
MDLKSFFNTLSEIIYILCGLVSISTAFRGLKNEKAKIGTFLFWFILGVIFIFGNAVPYEVTGALLIILGLITVTNQLQIGNFAVITHEFKIVQSQKFKNKIFIPALLIGVSAFLILQFKIGKVTVPSAVGIGGGAIISLIVASIILKPKLKETNDDTARLLMQVGASALLPQLLAALGAVFKEAGVGNVISQSISAVVPSGNIFLGIVIYAIGMALFTMIMGNAFAAFSVITAGIGIPFILKHGGNPAVIGALGMTAGYCGTLMTPMAANFNIVPASILEIKDKNGIIKTQLPMALVLLAVHIILMLILFEVK